MYTINVCVRGSDKFSELIVNDLERTEFTIESIVGMALLEIFNTLHIEKVTIHHSPERNDRDEEWG